MPNKWTFKIKPIKRLLCKYVGDGKGWVDPFAGMHSPAEYTNDLNPKMPTKYHMDAIAFLKSLNGYEYCGCLFDPPYSPHEVARHYQKYGQRFFKNSMTFSRILKDEMARVIKPGGYCLSFGWSTCGIGKKRHFEIIEILLIAHGGHHNDTIVTVEKNILKG